MKIAFWMFLVTATGQASFAAPPQTQPQSLYLAPFYEVRSYFNNGDFVRGTGVTVALSTQPTTNIFKGQMLTDACKESSEGRAPEHCRFFILTNSHILVGKKIVYCLKDYACQEVPKVEGRYPLIEDRINDIALIEIFPKIDSYLPEKPRPGHFINSPFLQAFLSTTSALGDPSEQWQGLYSLSEDWTGAWYNRMQAGEMFLTEMAIYPKKNSFFAGLSGFSVIPSIKDYAKGLFEKDLAEIKLTPADFLSLQQTLLSSPLYTVFPLWLLDLKEKNSKPLPFGQKGQNAKQAVQYGVLPYLTGVSQSWVSPFWASPGQSGSPMMGSYNALAEPLSKMYGLLVSSSKWFKLSHYAHVNTVMPLLKDYLNGVREHLNYKLLGDEILWTSDHHQNFFRYLPRWQIAESSTEAPNKSSAELSDKSNAELSDRGNAELADKGNAELADRGNTKSHSDFPSFKKDFYRCKIAQTSAVKTFVLDPNNSALAAGLYSEKIKSHILGFKIPGTDGPLFANWEALLYLDKMKLYESQGHKPTPILPSQPLHDYLLKKLNSASMTRWIWQDSFSFSKKISLNLPSPNTAWSTITLQVSKDFTQIILQRPDGLKVKYRMDQYGRIEGCGQKSFSPYLVVEDSSGKLIIDLRNLYFIDLTALSANKKEDAVARTVEHQLDPQKIISAEATQGPFLRLSYQGPNDPIGSYPEWLYFK
ncbi:MAG: hypothetical protein ACOYOK_03970 [Pseudobdellovibrionaceae bacterium]